MAANGLTDRKQAAPTRRPPRHSDRAPHHYRRECARSVPPLAAAPLFCPAIAPVTARRRLVPNARKPARPSVAALRRQRASAFFVTSVNHACRNRPKRQFVGLGLYPQGKRAFSLHARDSGWRQDTANGTAYKKGCLRRSRSSIQKEAFSRIFLTAWKPASHIVETTAPPSRRMFCPTIKPACIEQRNAQAAPNSAVVP